MNRRFQGKLKVTQSDIINILGDLNAVTYQGVIDCSSNPNYPPADAGDIYIISVAGKIGGASGTVVIAGDMIICKTDSTASGTQATVGANWNVIEKNIDLTNVVISGGTISGTNITVGAGKTLDVSAGTLTLAADQISGDKVEGGTINAVTINTLTSTTVNATTVDTNVAAAGVTLSGITLAADGTDANIDINITPKGTGEVNITKVDIDAGTIDGATISTSNVTVGSGKTIDVSAGTLTLANDQISGDKIHGGTISAFTSTGIDDNADAVAITIDSSERVGIGTASPTDKLDVIGTAVGSSVGISIINYTPYGAGVGYPTARVSMGHSTLAAASAASIMGYIECGNSVETSSATGHLILGTRTDASNVTEKMRITSAGNVGIGTTSPVNKLDIEGGVAIGSTYSGTSTAPTNGLIVEGNVGIGTSSPGTKLEVSLTAGSLIRIASFLTPSMTDTQKNYMSIGTVNDANSAFILSYTHHATKASRIFSITPYERTPNDTSSFNLAATGNVGIGVVPVNKLDVEGAVAIGASYSGTSTAPADGLIVKGKVGIGTSSPNANAILDVTSTTKAFMPPRMTTAQRDAVSSPAAGMVIYNTTTNVLNFHNGTAWGAV